MLLKRSQPGRDGVEVGRKGMMRREARWEGTGGVQEHRNVPACPGSVPDGRTRLGHLHDCEGRVTHYSTPLPLQGLRQCFVRGGEGKIELRSRRGGAIMILRVAWV